MKLIYTCPSSCSSQHACPFHPSAVFLIAPWPITLLGAPRPVHYPHSISAPHLFIFFHAFVSYGCFGKFICLGIRAHLESDRRCCSRVLPVTAFGTLLQPNPSLLGCCSFMAFLIVFRPSWQPFGFSVFGLPVTCWGCDSFRMCWGCAWCNLLTCKLRAIKHNYTLQRFVSFKLSLLASNKGSCCKFRRTN